jgi:hypothetical protein
MAIVYQHRRSDTNEVFYIGIGKTKNRAYKLNNRNKYWIHIADKVGWDVDILFEGVTWEDACIIEKGLISDIGRKDLGLGPLVNMTDGGDGQLNPNKETRTKISKAHKGRKFTEDHINNLSKARKGNKYKPHSENTKKKMSKSHKGKTFSDETKNKMSKVRSGIPKPERRKKVFQYSLDRILVNMFDSYSDALEKTKIKGMANALSGRSKTAGGFIWLYKKIENEN